MDYGDDWLNLSSMLQTYYKLVNASFYKSLVATRFVIFIPLTLNFTLKYEIL